MPLERVKSLMDTLTGRVSENVRMLSFAAVALIWVIADQRLERLTSRLQFAAGAVTFALAFDFLQYVWSAAALKILVVRKKLAPNGHLVFPASIRWIGFGLLAAKAVALMAAFAFIVAALVAYTPESPRPLPPEWPCISWPATKLQQ